MDGYTAWKLHRAIKLHLLTSGYDVFEQKGNVKGTSMDAYMKSRDKPFFELLARHFDKPNDAVQFFVSNIAYTGKDNIYELASSWDNYVLWVKHKESLTKLICDDLDVLDLSKDLESNFATPPKIMQYLMIGKVLPETLVAIDAEIPFIDKLLAKDYFGLSNWPIIIKKLKRFVKYNFDTVNKRLHETTI